MSKRAGGRRPRTSDRKPGRVVIVIGTAGNRGQALDLPAWPVTKKAAPVESPAQRLAHRDRGRCTAFGPAVAGQAVRRGREEEFDLGVAVVRGVLQGQALG